MRRIPPPDDYRANIHRGAKFVRAEVSPSDEKINKKTMRIAFYLIFHFFLKSFNIFLNSSSKAPLSETKEEICSTVSSVV